ncbi:unnamed protein product, partial [marine sediment metagenome]
LTALTDCPREKKLKKSFLPGARKVNTGLSAFLSG